MASLIGPPWPAVTLQTFSLVLTVGSVASPCDGLRQACVLAATWPKPAGSVFVTDTPLIVSVVSLLV